MEPPPRPLPLSLLNEVLYTPPGFSKESNSSKEIAELNLVRLKIFKHFGVSVSQLHTDEQTGLFCFGSYGIPSNDTAAAAPAPAPEKADDEEMQDSNPPALPTLAPTPPGVQNEAQQQPQQQQEQEQQQQQYAALQQLQTYTFDAPPELPIDEAHLAPIRDLITASEVRASCWNLLLNLLNGPHPPTISSIRPIWEIIKIDVARPLESLTRDLQAFASLIPLSEGPRLVAAVRYIPPTLMGLSMAQATDYLYFLLRMDGIERAVIGATPGDLHACLDQLIIGDGENVGCAPIVMDVFLQSPVAVRQKKLCELMAALPGMNAEGSMPEVFAWEQGRW